MRYFELLRDRLVLHPFKAESRDRHIIPSHSSILKKAKIKMRGKGRIYARRKKLGYISPVKRDLPPIALSSLHGGKSTSTKLLNQHLLRAY